MVNRLINLRLPDQMLKGIKFVVKQGMFTSSTDFIRASIRKMLEEYELQRDIAKLKALQGSQKKLKVPFTKEERLKTFMAFNEKRAREISKKYGLDKLRQAGS